MALALSVPLQVLGIGIVISYGIAFIIKLLLTCIRRITNYGSK